MNSTRISSVTDVVALFSHIVLQCFQNAIDWTTEDIMTPVAEVCMFTLAKDGQFLS